VRYGQLPPCRQMNAGCVIAPQTESASLVHSFTVAWLGGNAHPVRTRHTVPMSGEIDAGRLHHSMKAQSARGVMSSAWTSSCRFLATFQLGAGSTASLLLCS